MAGESEIIEVKQQEQGQLGYMPEWFRILVGAYLKYREAQKELVHTGTRESNNPLYDSDNEDDQILVVDE